MCRLCGGGTRTHSARRANLLFWAGKRPKKSAVQL